MDATIGKANEEKSQFAPRIHTIMIPTDKIRDLIGPGGKVIRGIIDATGVKIDVDDTGRVNVASSDADGLARAIQMISDITAVPEIGKTYLGKVVRIAEFGAFVEIFPGTDGLLHVSEIAEHRVDGGEGRASRGRPDSGEGALDRRQSHQAFAQGCAARAAREAWPAGGWRRRRAAGLGVSGSARRR